MSFALQCLRIGLGTVLVNAVEPCTSDDGVLPWENKRLIGCQLKQFASFGGIECENKSKNQSER